MIKIKKTNKIKDELLFNESIYKSLLDIPLISGTAISLKELTTKIVSEANIEERDEYLNTKEIAIHVNMNKKLNSIDKANRIPKYVATPLPPLNFNQIGKTCPKKAARQET